MYFDKNKNVSFICAIINQWMLKTTTTAKILQLDYYKDGLQHKITFSSNF